jgi:hypothetical protein
MSVLGFLLWLGSLIVAFALGILTTLDLHERGEAAREAERVERRKGHGLAGEPGESGFGDQTYGPAIEARYSGDGTPL